MEVKNLTQLKKALTTRCFEVVEHYMHPEYTGQVRYVSKMQTNGMYTYVRRNGDKVVNGYNNGRGLWCDFLKASNWEFNGELCTFFLNNNAKVWTIRILDETIE